MFIVPKSVRQPLTIIVTFLGLGYFCLCACSFCADQRARSGTLEGLSVAARVDPNNSEYWRRLGLVRLYEENDGNGAVADFQRAIELNPRNADSWIGIAYAYQFLGRETEERAAISSALHAEPKRPEIVWQAANLYAVLGDRRLMANALCITLQRDAPRADSALDLAYRTTGVRAVNCVEEKESH